MIEEVLLQMQLGDGELFEVQLRVGPGHSAPHGRAARLETLDVTAYLLPQLDEPFDSALSLFCVK